MAESFFWTDRPFDKAPDLTLNSDSSSLGYGNAVVQAISSPEYGEPVISTALGEPIDKSTSSPGYGEPAVKSSASPGYGEPVVRSNSSPKYGEPEINSNSAPGYGEPVVKSNYSPRLAESVVTSNSSPEYGEPVDKSPGIVDGEVQSNLSEKTPNSSLNPSETDSHYGSETKIKIGEASFKNVKNSEKSPNVVKPNNIVYITTEDPNLSRTESNKENSATGKQSEPTNKVDPEKFNSKNNPSERITFGSEENTLIADPKPAETPGKLLIAEKLTGHPSPISEASGTLAPILAPVSKTELFLSPDPDYVYEVCKVVLFFFG